MSEITKLHLSLNPARAAEDATSVRAFDDDVAHPDRRLRLAFLIMASLNAFMVCGAGCLLVLCYLRF